MGLHSIFISYAHADNRDGWVDAFHASLENRLAVLGVSAEVWRDRRLSGADVFSDAILDQLKQSVLLISILSPSAVKSRWCEKERQRFEQYAQARGGFSIGSVSRALKVVMTPAEEDAHKEIFGTLGYDFFELNSQTRLYDHYQPTDHRFGKVIDRLAQEIRKLLPAFAAAAARSTKPAVFVAEVSADLEADRAKVVDQLRAWGYRVVPSEPLPAQGSRLRGAIESGVGEAVLSVHLLSDKRGVIPDEEDKSILALQYELAGKRGLDRIVWILPGTEPHPAIEQELRQGAMHGLERLEGQRTIEDLKEILAAKLTALDDRPRGNGNGSKRNIYVVCDAKDHPFSTGAPAAADALQLMAFLERFGYRVWFPPRQCE